MKQRAPYPKENPYSSKTTATGQRGARGEDFSELVQELLEFWVEIQQGANPEILNSNFRISKIFKI